MNNRYNPKIHNRKSIRLKGYDYSQEGLYFISICVKGRKYLFGEIKNGKMNLNDAGVMIEKQWLQLSKRFKNIILYEFIIMPNHFHGIIKIGINAGATFMKGQPQGIAPTGSPPTGSPSTGSPPTGLTSTGLTSTGLTSTGSPPTGLPSTGLTSTGLPSTGLTSTGSPSTGLTSTGSPSTGLTSTELTPTGLTSTGLTSTGSPPTGLTSTGLPTNKTIGDIIGAFKSISTNEYIKGVKTNNWQMFNGKLWQRNYWEYIIRNENAYRNISNYIINNPKKWNVDKLKKK